MEFFNHFSGYNYVWNLDFIEIITSTYLLFFSSCILNIFSHDLCIAFACVLQLYWLAPIAGGVIAGLLYEYIFDPKRCKQPVQSPTLDTIDGQQGKRETPAGHWLTQCVTNPCRVLSWDAVNYCNDKWVIRYVKIIILQVEVQAIY